MAPQRPMPPNPMGWHECAVDTVFLLVALGFVLLRLWARRLKNTALHLSDILIILAWLIAAADLVTTYVVVYWGAGLYMADLQKYNPTGEVDIGKVTYASYFTWVIEITLIKLAILLVYRTIFYVMETFVRVVNYTMIFVIITFVGFVIGLLLQCTPIAFNWEDVPGGYCGLNVETTFVISGSVNLALDIWLVVLPIKPVWSLQHVSKMKRLGINATFGLGILICILVGLRFKLIADTDEAEFNHDGEGPGILIAMEVYLGIIGACLPVIPPALRVLRSRVRHSYFSELLGRVRLTLRSSNGGSIGSGAILLDSRGTDAGSSPHRSSEQSPQH